MNTYITFTKKGLIVLFCLFVCIAFICLQIANISNTQPNALTNGDRLIFIKSLGFNVTDNQPSVKEVNIPETFFDVYNKYNQIQSMAGYDLSQYKGCKVNIYTYNIDTPSNYSGECVVNLIVYKNRIIGGDVSSAALGGFMLPLKKIK